MGVGPAGSKGKTDQTSRSAFQSNTPPNVSTRSNHTHGIADPTTRPSLFGDQLVTQHLLRKLLCLSRPGSFRKPPTARVQRKPKVPSQLPILSLQPKRREMN